MTLVKEIMTKNVKTMPKNKDLHSLVVLMSDKKISCVVITEKGKVAGIVTERDLINKVLHPKKSVTKLKIADIMTKNISGLKPDSTLVEAERIMKVKKIRHLPVTQNGRLKGLVTQTDIVRETGAIEIKNKNFMTYQNIQSIVIIIFFGFLVAYLVYLFWF